MNSNLFTATIYKPFNLREVVARVKAVLRRTKSKDVISTNLHIDENRLLVIFNGMEASLTAVEFQLLKSLFSKLNRIFTREQLMQNMYPDHRLVNHRAIGRHIKKLRKKLLDISQGEELIQSVYGVGYRLIMPEEN